MKPCQPNRQPLLQRRSLPYWGALGGGLLGFVDAIAFSSIDWTTSFDGRELNGGVVIGFTLTLGIFGFLLGRLILARAQAQADRQTISEQHAALEASQQALVQQEKLAALGRLVASIAHELRNPLGVIRSAAGILEESVQRPPADSPQLRRAAELVTEEVDHMNATITALLAFARPAKLKVDDVALEKVFERALRLNSEGSAAGVDIQHRLPEQALKVLGDVHLLTQVVAGLVHNAVEAVDGHGHIELRAHQDDDSVHIEVVDDGPGITDDDAERIFEPFYSTKTTGTGLGLALAHRVADAHGGRLEVIPNAGLGAQRQGACLRLSLPAALGGTL